MSDETKINDDLYQQFFAVVGENKKISQARAAKKLGLSPCTISLYKNKTYNSNVTAIEEKMQAFLNREEWRESDTIAIPIVETTTIDNIRTAVEMAYDYRDIAVVVGPSGTGKTTAVQKYEEENPGSAVVVYVHQGITPYRLLVTIAEAIGVYGKGSKSVLVERIVEELRDRNMVLIIDQADYLPDRALELLRCITVDMAEVGLVLVGLPRLKTQLRNLHNDHEQLLSRVGTFLEIDRMRDSDAEKIIRGVWESAAAEVITGLIKAAAGSTRKLIKLIERTHRIMVVYRKEMPNYDIINSAKDLLMQK
jgi:DNA transposition AAA+ family ATPase